MMRPWHIMVIVAASSLLTMDCTNEADDAFAIEKVNDSTFTYLSYGKQGRINLMTDSLHHVCHYVEDSLMDVWTIRDSVYRFDCGDLNADSVPEILVGVICATRYRPELDKRLYIFKLYKGELIRPLWLGSRVGLPLADFRVERDSLPNMVHTWEWSTDSTLVQAIYRLQGFGLKFVTYLN